MGKKIISIHIFIFSVALFYSACGFRMNRASVGAGSRVPLNEIEVGFISPPDSIPLGVFWFWLSDNISAEGVVKDLHAMKKVGINRAFIANVQKDHIPKGEVKMFSDEWWGVIHAALKTATELNIEIGIFNCPGWSQ